MDTRQDARPLFPKTSCTRWSTASSRPMRRPRCVGGWRATPRRRRQCNAWQTQRDALQAAVRGSWTSSRCRPRCWPPPTTSTQARARASQWWRWGGMAASVLLAFGWAGSANGQWRARIVRASPWRAAGAGAPFRGAGGGGACPVPAGGASSGGSQRRPAGASGAMALETAGPAAEGAGAGRAGLRTDGRPSVAGRQRRARPVHVPEQRRPAADAVSWAR